MTAAPRRYRQSSQTISTPASCQTIVVNLETGRYYGLSQTATLIWLALAQPHTTTEVIATVRVQVTGPSPTLETEVATFFTNLQAEGLLEPAPPEAPAPAPPAPPPHRLIPYAPPVIDRGTLSAAANGALGQPDGSTDGNANPLES